jgi:hypothetical protein
MTNEQINIAIAEACGYEWRVGIYGNCRGLFHPDDNYLKEQPCLDILLPISGDCAYRVPDYCNDLNAMHEAEKTLSHKQRMTYCKKLFDLPTSELESNTFATSLQRAEAFLKTIGKWEDGK